MNWWKMASDEILNLSGKMKSVPINNDAQNKQKLIDYINRIRSEGYPNPFNDREIVINNEAAVIVKPFDGKIVLESIRALEPGHGAGSRTLKLLTDIADEMGVTLTGDPVPIGKKTLNKKQLIDWYKRNGFEYHKNGEGIVRSPVTKVVKNPQANP